MSSFPLLSSLIFIPLLGALLIFISTRASEAGEKKALWYGIAVSTLTFFLSLYMWHSFDPTSKAMQLTEEYAWAGEYGISYSVGVDGISLFFILLTTFLTPICLVASMGAIKQRLRLFTGAFLLLEAMTIGVFCATDLLVFYIFFEAVLIPMFLIIGVWGGENRTYAAFKFFLYTLLGSVLLLLAILYMYHHTDTTNLQQLAEKTPLFSLPVQQWLWLALFASFAVKVPMWPVHTWLPDAHVQAPTSGSVILAGILLKLGGYGFLRLSLPLLPDASLYFANMMFALSVIAIIYTSLVALAQEDMKKLIAYSSIAHMGYVTLGIFAFTPQAVEGAIVQMLSHGLVSAALFLCVGVLYDRMHTRTIEKFGGVTQTMPRFALTAMIFTMASVGLPATSGFVGEFLVLLGTFQANIYVAALASTGVVLGAAYMLLLYRRVFFGEIKNPDVAALTDLNLREKIIFVPLIVLVIIIGIYPSVILKPMHASVAGLLESYTEK